VPAKSDQDPDLDWFVSLDTDPDRGKKLVLVPDQQMRIPNTGVPDPNPDFNLHSIGSLESESGSKSNQNGKM
jgi:hypothetical protein